MNIHHRQIYDYIAGHPGCSVRQITEALGMEMRTVRIRMDRMKEKDYLLTEGTCRRQRYTVKGLIPEFEQGEAYVQAPSIWRVAARIAAEVRGVEWRA